MKEVRCNLDRGCKMESCETMEECENPPLSEGLKLGVSSDCQNIIIIEVRCVYVSVRQKITEA